MSFSNIKDPLEAQRKVEDYMRIKAELKREWEEKRESQTLRDASLEAEYRPCLLYTSPSPRDLSTSRMPSSA